MDIEALCAENLLLRQEVERQRLQIQELACRAAFGSGALHTPPGSDDGLPKTYSGELEPAEEPAATSFASVHEKANSYLQGRHLQDVVSLGSGIIEGAPAAKDRGAKPFSDAPCQPSSAAQQAKDQAVHQPPLGPPAPMPPTPLASATFGRTVAAPAEPALVAVAKEPDRRQRSPLAVPASAGEQYFVEGRRVEAFYQDKWFVGTIVGLPSGDKEGSSRWAVQCDVDRKGEVLYTKHIRRIPESNTVTRFISTGSTAGGISPRVSSRPSVVQTGTMSVPAPGRPVSFLKTATPAVAAGYPATAAFRVAAPVPGVQRLGAMSPPRAGPAASPEPVRRQPSVGTPITPRYVSTERNASPYLASCRGGALGSSTQVPAKQARVLVATASGSTATTAASGGAATPLPPGGFPRTTAPAVTPMASMQAVWGASGAASTSLQPPALGRGTVSPGSPHFGGGCSISARAGGSSPQPAARVAAISVTPASPRLP